MYRPCPRTGVCGEQHHHGLRNPARRLDPFDPTTSRHFGQCEHRDTTDPALLRVILKVRDHPEWGYWYVVCGACGSEWQVPYNAAESVG